MDEDEQASSALAPRQKLLALASTVRANLKEAPPPARDALVEYEAEVSRLLDGYERMAGEKESLAREKEKAHRRIVEWANAFKNKAKEVSQLEEELERRLSGMVGGRGPLLEAVEGADLVVTNTWVSMHDSQSSKERRHNMLRPYQVNAELMKHAKDDALFMHCLPAHREEEVTSPVMDGPHSVIFDEAENRLHAQKAVMRWCLGK